MVGIPVLAHAGDHPNVHTLLFIEPTSRRGAVLLLNGQNMVAQFGAFREIEAGVARLLAGQEPAPITALPLPTLYYLIDTLLGGLLLLAFWSFLQLPHWEQRLQGQQAAGQMRLWRVGLRVFWEITLPLGLLVGGRLLLHALGAQSWAEGLLLFPDFGTWLWLFALLMLSTGVLRFMRLPHVYHKGHVDNGLIPHKSTPQSSLG